MAVSPIDKIGDRLDHPENVPEELQHLIADDVARVEKILSIPVSGRVLDVGCSDGAITRRIQDRWREASVSGCDIRPCAPPFFEWDIRRPALNLRPYDAIYACEVLEHLTDNDAQLALTNILAVLKRGGDLIVTVPNRNPHDNYEVGCRARWAWPDHRSSWTVRKLADCLDNSRFDRLRWLPLYDGENTADSIWLIVHASGKK